MHASAVRALSEHALPTVGDAEIELDGRIVRVTNLDKALWPRTGTTKRQLIDYYMSVAPAMLPHVARRPLTLARFPDGVDGKGWFQTSCPHPPEWLETFRVTDESGRVVRDHCVITDRAGLIWLVNLASIEVHSLLWRLPRVEEPSAVVFDLDPGEGTELAECFQAALAIKDHLSSVGLESFPNLSGWAGVHVQVPVAPGHSFVRTKEFARGIAAEMARSSEEITDRFAHRDRVGRVLIDWRQNAPSLSVVAPYSLRALAEPSVAAPLTWEEVGTGAEAEPLLIGPEACIERLGRYGDLLAPVLELHQRLPAA